MLDKHIPKSVQANGMFLYITGKNSASIRLKLMLLLLILLPKTDDPSPIIKSRERKPQIIDPIDSKSRGRMSKIEPSCTAYK